MYELVGSYGKALEKRLATAALKKKYFILDFFWESTFFWRVQQPETVGLSTVDYDITFINQFIFPPNFPKFF